MIDSNPCLFYNNLKIAEVMKRKIKKEVRQLIKESLIKGETNKYIYNDLVKEYGDKKTIAELIVTTVKPKDKKKHYLYIGILLAFTAIVVLINLWIISKEPPDLYFWPNSHYFLSEIFLPIFFYIVILFNNVCSRPITYYIFWMYSCSFLIIYFLFYQGILPNWSTEWGIYWLYMGIDLIFLFFAIFLARLFQRKIFPDYRYRKLKQDNEGKYVFS